MAAVDLFPELDSAEANVAKLSASSHAFPDGLTSMRQVRPHLLAREQLDTRMSVRSYFSSIHCSLLTHHSS